ncbi:hypothetical protein ACFQ0G_01315 [Streptomyces chiangmaiensis]
MTATTRARVWPAPSWTPPLDSEALATVLAKIHKWEAFDGGALLDDVAIALDEVIPKRSTSRTSRSVSATT